LGHSPPTPRFANQTSARTKLPALVQAAATIGAAQIQNRGTIGGNIVNASPAGDTLPVLLATDAEFVLGSARGERTVAADSFWPAYRKPDRAADELLIKVRIPLPVGRQVRFRKVGTRRAQAISKVVLALVWREDGGVWRDVRLALGSVAATPVRAKQTEAVLEGAAARQQTADHAAETLAAENSPDRRCAIDGRLPASGRLACAAQTPARRGRLVTTCPSCGASAADDARFCANCGTPLQPAGGEERKLATIVFADVIGSTDLGEQLDPERLRALLAEYFGQMSRVIETWGGTVEKYIGDAIMAVFGVPIAREDDAVRALNAAREMIGQLEKLNPGFEERHGVRLGVRIGVNTGEVLAPSSASAGGQFLVQGDPVNVAARLEQAADPATVLVGERTWLAARAASISANRSR
jgi:class 3 adenylate cyclase